MNHKHTFDWKKFKGSAEALKWNQRDLDSVDQIVELVPGRTACVQAGGNLGIFAKYLARFFAAVFTFEPAPELFAKLNANVGEPNVIRMQAALGDTPGLVGTACRRRGDDTGPAHEGLTHVAGGGIIPTVRLDDLALPTVDLLYLDVEGFEFFALRGAAQTIARCRPVIAVEVNRNIGFYNLQADDVRDFITQRGYRKALSVRSDEVYLPC